MKFFFFIFLITLNTVCSSLEHEVIDKVSIKHRLHSLVESEKNQAEASSYFVEPVKNRLWKCIEGLTMILAFQSAIRPVQGEFNFFGTTELSQELAHDFNTNWGSFIDIIKEPQLSHRINRYSVQFNNDSIPFVFFKHDGKTDVYYTYKDILDDFTCCEIEECASTAVKNIKLSEIERGGYNRKNKTKREKHKLLKVETEFKPFYEDGFMCSIFNKVILFFNLKAAW